MKLPKRTNYRGFIVTSALVLTFSTVATLGGDFAANALTLPFGLGELGQDASQKKDTTDDKKAIDIPALQPTTPAAPTTTTDTTAKSATSPVQSTTNSTTSSTQKKSVVVTPVVQKVDTAAQVTQLASAQAVKSIRPTVYQSDKITIDTRDQLYKAAAIAAGVGAILYLLSYTRPWKWMYRNLIEAPKIVTQ